MTGWEMNILFNIISIYTIRARTKDCSLAFINDNTYGI